MEKFNYGVNDDGSVDADGPRSTIWRDVEVRSEDGAVEVSGGRRYVAERVITPENVRDYGLDRSKENLEMLEESGNSQMVGLYKKLIDEKPELRAVKLINEDIKVGAMFSASMRDTTTGQLMPAVNFNFSHPETYRLKLTEAWSSVGERGEEKNYEVKFLSKILAVGAGADWRRCARNKKLMSSLVFLHEMGHAEDFINNYLASELDRQDGMPLNTKMAESLKAAEEQAALTKSNDPANYIPAGTPAKVAVRRYRGIGEEKYADQFAFDYIARHEDEFFVDNGTLAGEEKTVGARVKGALKDFAFGEDRVPLEFGREMPMDEDFAYIMGLTYGNNLRVEPVYKAEPTPSPYALKDGDYGLYDYEQSKKYNEQGEYIAAKHVKRDDYIGKHEILNVEGIAMAELREGGPIYLREKNGNPVTVCGNASGYRYVSERHPRTGRITTQVFFNDETGRKFRVERVSD